MSASDPSQVGPRTGPLAHLRVVELPGLAPVPFAAMLLADLGADVVRISRPAHARTPLEIPETGPVYRGRRSVALDLKDEGDLAELLRLTDRADVLLEGFRPGVMERLGAGPDVCCGRNPRLVYGRLTGWGQDGPLADQVGHDITYLAVSGALGAIGPADAPPVVPVNYVADFGGGSMLMVVGVLAALAERERSGLGQVVDAAMVDGAALLSASVLGLHQGGLWSAPRGKNLLDGGAPFYSTYVCADGRHLAVGALEPAYYVALLAGLGLAGEDLPAQQDMTGWPTLRRRFAEVIAQHPRGHWESVFAGTSACVAPVLAPWEAADHPHAVARGAFIEVDGRRQPAPAPGSAVPRSPRRPASAPTAGPSRAAWRRTWSPGESERGCFRSVGPGPIGPGWPVF